VRSLYAGGSCVWSARQATTAPGAQRGAAAGDGDRRRAGGALRADRLAAGFSEPDPAARRMGRTKQTSAVAAPFILVNSIPRSPRVLPRNPPLARLCMDPDGVVLAGGWAGAEYGSRRFANPVIRRRACGGAAIAGGKMASG